LWESEKSGPRVGLSWTYFPAQVQARTAAPPMSDASTMCPFRITYIQSPTNRAMGMVQAMVKVPHELPRIRRTEPAGSGNSRPSGAEGLRPSGGGGADTRTLSLEVISAVSPG
jgi:hypothetical protein